MKDLRTASAFKRDLKRIAKRGYDLARLQHVVDLLRDDQELPEEYRDHVLRGDWGGFRECHIASDWLLIYQTTDAEAALARTGSHSDLFG